MRAFGEFVGKELLHHTNNNNVCVGLGMGGRLWYIIDDVILQTP